MDVSRSTSPNLLDLPAEVRNNIYRLVLVDDFSVVYDSGSWDAVGTGLLLTCKQTHQEAIDIYYAENLFEFMMPSHDPHALPRLPPRTLRKMAGRIQIWWNDPPNWPNFELWLRRIHNGEIEMLYHEGHYDVRKDCDAEEIAWNAASNLAYELRDLPWSRVAGLLEDWRKALIEVDSRWG